MAIISIIVPVYNTGVVIHDTIKSILNQTYTDFELLLIDDGSTDGTSKICDEYAKKDSRIKVFHKENGGICDARNYGLSKITTKYLTFCDHDDLFHEELLEKTVSLAEKEKCDVVKFLTITRDNEGKVLSSVYPINNDLYKIKNSYLYLLERGFLNVIWGRIYKSDIIIKNNLKFDTKFKHGGEDFDFNIKLYSNKISTVLLPEILYFHIFRPELSTSARLYEDLKNNFLVEIVKVNILLKNLCVVHLKERPQYMHFYMKRIISFISYSVQLKVNKNEIIYQLKEFRTKTDLLPNNITYKIFNRYAMNKKEKIFFILWKLYYSNNLNLLYYILKLNYILR